MSRISASEDRNLGICDKRFGKEKRISSELCSGHEKMAGSRAFSNLNLSHLYMRFA